MLEWVGEETADKWSRREVSEGWTVGGGEMDEYMSA